VAEQVQFGIEEKKSVRVLRDEAWLVNLEEPRSRPSNVMFAATRPYTEREKLRLLIDAIEQAIVGTADMEVSLHDELESLHSPARAILVREELDPKIMQIGDEAQAHRRTEAKRLGKLLSELREEA